MRVLIYTLGCKLNQCESEAIADAFTAEGFHVVKGNQIADLYIVNSCTVTSKAEQKARRMIRKYQAENPNSVVIATGCYAQMEREKLSTLGQRVVVIPLDYKSSLLTLPRFLRSHLLGELELLATVEHFAQLSEGQEQDVFAYDATSFSFHSRAFLKIQDGCDNECAYCRVTLARGSALSLAYPEVMRRALELEHEGYREIVLTGVNISAYQDQRVTLGGLLAHLLAQLQEKTYLRLSSLEPDRIDQQLLATLADRRIQSHFHLPIQTASDLLLQRCKRNYQAHDLSAIISTLRQVKDDPFIAADIIVGLPGESDKEFERTVEFVKEQDLSQLHVFPYSPRPDTLLYEAKDRIPEYIRDQRAKVLRDLSQLQWRSYVKRQLGKEVPLLLENRQQGQWLALSGNYLKVLIHNVPPQVEAGELFWATLEPGKQGHLLAATYPKDSL